MAVIGADLPCRNRLPALNVGSAKLFSSRCRDAHQNTPRNFADSLAARMQQPGHRAGVQPPCQYETRAVFLGALDVADRRFSTAIDAGQGAKPRHRRQPDIRHPKPPLMAKACPDTIGPPRARAIISDQKPGQSRGGSREEFFSQPCISYGMTSGGCATTHCTAMSGPICQRNGKSRRQEQP